MLRIQGNGSGILHAEEAVGTGSGANVSNHLYEYDREEGGPKKQRRGISAPRMLIPIIIVLFILHALIIYLIISINSTSGALSSTMQRAGTYTSDASSLLACTSMMAETSSNYILLPALEDGAINFGPLVAYTSQLESDRRGDAVAARFQEYDVSPEILGLVQEAADCHNKMVENQLHAIALIASVYPLPPIPPLADLKLPELTEEEMGYTDAEKLSAGRYLILGEEQGNNKSTVSGNVNSVIEMIQGSSAQVSAVTSQKLAMLRTVMWVVTLTIILILALTFVILYQQLVFPLGKFVKLIAQDEPLDDKKGLEEVRLVADAYNNLLERRDALDSILRSAAETDTLTNLPNRYSYQRYILELEDDPSSLAVFLFDVNFLKETNDTKGHAAGDQLLRDAATCIAQSFGTADQGACFRMGGDEFAAVISGCDQIMLGRMIERFETLQKEYKVSISYGYDYTDSLATTTVRNLMNQADQNMYIYKNKVHKERTQPPTS